MTTPAPGHDWQYLVDAAVREGITKFVAGAVIHDGGRILIVRRAPDDEVLPGYEELPSGGVEPGETLLQALRRELSEEIDAPLTLTPEPGFVTSFDYASSSGGRARQYTFAIAYTGHPIVLSAEHTAYRWITLDEVDDADFTPDTAESIRAWAAAAGL